MDAAPPAGTDALTSATVALAAATVLVALIPILIRQWDIGRFKKAGTLQLDIILRNVEVRISTLAENPHYSRRVLLAGIDMLFTRALSSDFADVRPAGDMSFIYGALSSAYEVIVSAVEQERDVKEAQEEAPFRMTPRDVAILREPGHRLLQDKAKLALRDLRAARALLQEGGRGGIRGILLPANGVKALRNPFVQGFR